MKIVIIGLRKVKHDTTSDHIDKGKLSKCII